MSDPPHLRRRTGRIIVGLRADADIDPSLEAATILAAAIEAEIVGLYVQEDAMLDLAALPFARALGPDGLAPQRLTRDAMIKAFEQGATTCRRLLSAHAERARVSWSFNSERGTLATTVRSVMATGDFLVLSGDRLGFSTHRLIDELRMAPSGARGVLVAVSHRERRSVGPVVAIDDGDEAGMETVTLAARIAEVSGAGLHLFVVAANDADANRIVQRANRLVGPGKRFFAHRFLPGAPQTIAAAFSKFEPSFIVSDQEGEPFGNDQAARALLRAARAPVVLVKTMQTNNEC